MAYPVIVTGTVAVVGSRTFTDYELLRNTLDEHKLVKIRTIVSGGAAGADRLAERYAAERGIELIVLRPDWSTHGKSAGIMRNTDIVDRSDFVFAFWDGQSRGTADTINKAKSRGKPVVVVRI